MSSGAQASFRKQPPPRILDFDRDDEDDNSRRDWIDYASDVLTMFQDRGVDVAEWFAELDHMEPPRED